MHRDVKPSNVLLTGVTDEADMNPFAYLVDFGIARSSTQEGTALTATSGTIGTVAYMSPERIGGEHGDRRTDIYALACVLYEMLTGRKPFDGRNVRHLYAHVNTPPPKITDALPDAPMALDEVIAKGMAKDPEQRYASAGELAAAARSAVRAGARRADLPRQLPPTAPPVDLLTPPPLPRSMPPFIAQTATPPPPPAAFTPLPGAPPASFTPPPPPAAPPYGPPHRHPQPPYPQPPYVAPPHAPAGTGAPPAAAHAPDGCPGRGRRGGRCRRGHRRDPRRRRR